MIELALYMRLSKSEWTYLRRVFACNRFLFFSQTQHKVFEWTVYQLPLENNTSYLT